MILSFTFNQILSQLTLLQMRIQQNLSSASRPCTFCENHSWKQKNKQRNQQMQLRQGCALIKITRSPKVPNYEIQGAQHKAYMKEIRLRGRAKTKVSRLRHWAPLKHSPVRTLDFNWCTKLLCFLVGMPGI